MNLDIAMDYDTAMNIAHHADTMPVEMLYQRYEQFNAITDNTPDWMGPVGIEGVLIKNPGKPLGWQRAFHAAQGMVTEAGELLKITATLVAADRDTSRSHIIEELGDMTYYVTQYVRALNEQGLNLSLAVVLGDDGPDHIYPFYVTSTDLIIATTEVLDLFKKELYGKQKRAGADLMTTKLVPVVGHMKEIMGSLRSTGTPVRFRTLIADNTKKLANRYIEKFGR